MSDFIFFYGCPRCDFKFEARGDERHCPRCDAPLDKATMEEAARDAAHDAEMNFGAPPTERRKTTKPQPTR